jgi:hypothetical protein
MTNPQNQNLPEPEEIKPPDYTENNASDMVFAYGKNRIRIGLGMSFVGYLIFLLGARPSLFGLDRSPVVGFVQISVFLLGLAIICVGNYMTLNALWPDGQKTIAAEIGSRLISTGYVICVFAGMADIFGLGSHPLPNVFFGPLQAHGMTLGITTIAVGCLLLIRYRHKKPNNQTKTEAEPPMEGEAEEKHQAGSDQISIILSTLFR